MRRISRRDLLFSGGALSGSSLITRSVWGRTARLVNGLADVQLPGAVSTVPPRERLFFDFGWMFTFGHGSDPARDMGFGYGQGDFAKTGDFAFAKAKFDDSNWRTLNLPHDWAVELPFVRDDELQSHGYKPLGRRYPETSIGWYRRAFEIPAGDSSRRVSVEFDGAYRDVLIFVNGCYRGTHISGTIWGMRVHLSLEFPLQPASVERRTRIGSRQYYGHKAIGNNAIKYTLCGASGSRGWHTPRRDERRSWGWYDRANARRALRDQTDQLHWFAKGGEVDRTHLRRESDSCQAGARRQRCGCGVRGRRLR